MNLRDIDREEALAVRALSKNNRRKKERKLARLAEGPTNNTGLGHGKTRLCYPRPKYNDIDYAREMGDGLAYRCDDCKQFHIGEKP